jgi:hypothetical protein
MRERVHNSVVAVFVCHRNIPTKPAKECKIAYGVTDKKLANLWVCYGLAGSPALYPSTQNAKIHIRAKKKGAVS